MRCFPGPKSKIFVACLLCLLFPTSRASCSLRPEGVFVVVNQRSWSSKTLANNYIQLNRIPQSNVFSLDWDGTVITASYQEFRDRLLRPILREIEKRHLSAQIDCIAYSSDFPYAVDFKSKLSPADKDRFHEGSLTGMTYLYQQIDAQGGGFRALDSNWYANGSDTQTIPFDSRVTWSQAGSPSEGGGRRYLLSAMLGYVSGRGSAYEDVVKYLLRGSLASAAQPQGTVYLITNEDIRSKVRSPRFPKVIEALQRIGVGAEVVEGVYPKKKKDILGAVLGRHYFDNKGARILPGAIVENLTSFGGILDDTGEHLPLTSFLQRGAVGSSGTVIEPFALAQKFPDPMMHVHYARGLSLVESFYRSTKSPYQILLVGDPLCRPWSKPSRLTVGRFAEADVISGQINVRPRVSGEKQATSFELFVDGRLIGRCKPQQAFEVDTLSFPDGYHEFRVVATLADQSESTARWIGWRKIENGEHWCSATIVGSRQVPFGELISIDMDGSGPMSFRAFHHRRQLGVPTAQTSLVIDSKQLGLGMNAIQVVGVSQDGKRFFAKPVNVNVLPPRRMRSVMRTEARPLKLAKSGGTPLAFDSREANWLGNAGIRPGQSFEIDGDVLVKTEGVHQFQLYYAGRLSLQLDGSTISNKWHSKLERIEIPLHLSRGPHSLRIQCTPSDVSACELRFGYRGARKLKTPSPPKSK